jgi:uncharacterized membrane protein
MVLWIAIAVVAVALIAVMPRKRSWGPVTYRRKTVVGGPLSGRVMAIVLTVLLVVLLIVAFTR